MTKAKALVAAVMAVGGVLTAAFADDVFGASEVGTTVAVLVEQAIGVWAVWRVPNKPVPASTRLR
ncbi:hypothetical protein [Asanoa siamensis]|uniref:Holin n=1 Tax=Asanoa siamensis TaxID=926357 RepID=A0ABQ4CM62_9ACTN|nr:hypothetical protein [Asanoa siamensis]GIF71917.1 hypothetical protein Asi02nite_14350 [Asanoa siamensis]